MGDVLERLRSVQNRSAQYAQGSDIIRDAADHIQHLEQRLAEVEADNAKLLRDRNMYRDIVRRSPQTTNEV